MREALPITQVEWQTLAQITNTIYGTEFVPRGLRGNKPAVMACLMYGREQGLGPMVSLENVAIIDGKPSMDGSLLSAKIRIAGHSLTRKEHRDEDGKMLAVTAVGKRADSGDADEFTFSLEMAARAKLLAKDNWKNYPEAMLWNRALAALARSLFSDCFVGKVLTPEELGSEEAPEGAIEDAGDVESVATEVVAADPPSDDVQEEPEQPDEPDASGTAEAEPSTPQAAAPAPPPDAPRFDLGGYDTTSVEEVLPMLSQLHAAGGAEALRFVMEHEQTKKPHGDEGGGKIIAHVIALLEGTAGSVEAEAQPEPETPEPAAEPDVETSAETEPTVEEVQGVDVRALLDRCIEYINKKWPEQDSWHRGVILSDIGEKWRTDGTPETFDELTEDELVRLLAKVPPTIREAVEA